MKLSEFVSALCSLNLDEITIDVGIGLSGSDIVVVENSPSRVKFTIAKKVDWKPPKSVMH